MTQVAPITPPCDLPPQPSPTPRPAWWTRAIRQIRSALDAAFGCLSLIVGLALLSTVPILNFLSLGYLVHASGQVAQSGRLRSGFVGIRKASIAGSLVIGTWLVTLPVRLIASLAQDAELIAPNSPKAHNWRVALLILALLTLLHIVWACLRGGRLRHFLWPAPLRFLRWIQSPSKYATTRDTVLAYLKNLRLPYFFWLGARAFAGSIIWLLPPVATLILAAQLAPNQGGAILSLLGGLLLLIVVLYLPFLQTRFAIENRFTALLNPLAIRHLFQRAPIAFWLALLITLLFALPLYLLKIELPPRELAWLPGLLFVIFILPARLLTGWAVGRALHHPTPRHWIFRHSSRLALVGVAFLYVFFVYLTQYLTWNGTLSLLEQHAFLVPTPLLSL
ncbi:MAG: hypothetical protein RI897_1334 [Verrucomicrobiota bacterium]|jgi:hypothetical protein